MFPKPLWQVPTKCIRDPRFGFQTQSPSLSWRWAHDGGFQDLNRLLTLIQAGNGIDIEIHTHAVVGLETPGCGGRSLLIGGVDIVTTGYGAMLWGHYQRVVVVPSCV